MPTMTEASLMRRMQEGERWRPARWEQSSILRDGHCRIESHTFIEETPRTVGSTTSPAIYGLRRAMQQYGSEWVRV